MKFTLLNSCFYRFRRKDYIEVNKPDFRSGIASLAAVLSENNIDVSIEDPQAENLDLKGTLKRIIQSKPDIVGLPAYTEEISYASNIAKAIKNVNKDIKVIIGGPHISALPIDTLKEFDSFDIGIIGEGEKTIKDIAEGVNIEKIKGISYKRDGNIKVNPPRSDYISMDDLPFPAWYKYNLEKYDEPLPIEPLRGCPFSCIFCFRCIGRKVRYKSPKKIVDEIEFNIKKYKKSVKLKAGTFPLKKEHGLEVCKEILRRKLKINWGGSTRVDTVDKELLIKLKLAGCNSLNIGVESGDPEILKYCGKGINPVDVIEVFKICKRIGIKAGANFILGLPYETKSSLHKTYKLALKISKYADRANFAILTPFPGTKTYEMALKGVGGIRLKSKNWLDYGKQVGTVLFHENFPSGELFKFQSKLYFSWYLHSPNSIKRFVSLNRGFQLIKQLIFKKV